MTNNFKKFCVTLLILVNQMTFSEHIHEQFISQDGSDQAFTLFHAAPLPHIPALDNDPRNIITTTKRLAFLAVAPVLSIFKFLENKIDFLAPTVNIGNNNQPTDRSFKAFKSALYHFIETSHCNTIDEMNATLYAFLTLLTGGLDFNLLDESVHLAAESPLKGLTARDFSGAVHITPGPFEDED